MVNNVLIQCVYDDSIIDDKLFQNLSLFVRMLGCLWVSVTFVMVCLLPL